MNPFVIGLGSNLGDSRSVLQSAILSLNGAGPPGCSTVRAVSRMYRSPPVGLLDQPAFLNAAVLLEWEDSPRALLSALHSIERGHGRHRSGETVRWGPRLLDLDILLAGPEGMMSHVSSELTIPHPYAFDRAFVLKPLADVVPHWRHPGTGERVDLALVRVADDAGLVVPIDDLDAAYRRGEVGCLGGLRRDHGECRGAGDTGNSSGA